jgi:CheY-like chemotaxis protein
MMTYHHTATPTATIPSADPLLAFWGDRMPQSGLLPGKRHLSMRAEPRRRMALALAVEDGHVMSEALRAICDFLEISVKQVNSCEDLLPLLEECQPMAVIAGMDATGQDGCNVLMTVARHDPSLPVLLMTGAEPAAAGAVQAVTELWGLTEVMQTASWPVPGTLAEFLCRAGMRGHCLALMPV